jgi:uncharacterized protein involved in propanediol utilization
MPISTLQVITEQTTSGPTGELVQGALLDGKCLVVTIPTRLHCPVDVVKFDY